MKHDLSEKIDMVSASRCNLLSRSLPYYQKEVLLFNDTAANEFHKILVDLRSHHHHQYKVRRLAEEIRDLEAEESPFTDEPGHFIGDRSPTSTFSTTKSQAVDDDEPLLDVSNIESQAEQPAAPKPVGDDLLTLEKAAQEAKVNDMALSGAEAELRQLQDELLQPKESSDLQQPEKQVAISSTEPTAATAPAESEERDELGDLLQLGDEEGVADLEQTQQQDQLFDEWNNFSAFMPNTRAEPKSPTSGWEKEFMNSSSTASSDPLEAADSNTTAPSSAGQTPQSSQTEEKSSLPENTKQSKANVDKLLGISDVPQKEKEEESTLLSEDLESLGLGPPVKTNSTPRTQPTQQESPNVDSSYFSTQHMQHPPPGMMSQQPPFRSPLSISSGPIFPPGMMPLQQGMPSIMGPVPRLLMSSGMSTANGGERQIERKGKDQDKASTSWMNVFAHLDPLVNEKA